MAILTGKQVRVLVVDDSAFMRKAITMMLESDPMIKVIGSARDGAEGVEKVQLLKPDLVTMDIEMPRMDGLTALKEIMIKRPTPVMMISSITTDGARATLDAMELGAVDFIPKEMSYVSLDIVNIKDELLRKIKDISKRKSILMSQFRRRNFKAAATQITPARSAAARSTAAPVSSIRRVTRKKSHQIGLITIGVSTGGPPALQAIIPKLPRNLPVGVVIAQHMPAMFTKSLAERLNGLSELTVKEAEDRESIVPGTVLIAPGGKHLKVIKRGSQAFVSITEKPLDTLYHPCVDVMFDSVADAFGRAVLGVVLTGMGNNGVVGMAKLKAKGAVCIAQNEESCVVYGMPKAIIEAGLADHISPIERIADEVLSFF